MYLSPQKSCSMVSGVVVVFDVAVIVAVFAIAFFHLGAYKFYFLVRYI